MYTNTNQYFIFPMKKHQHQFIFTYIVVFFLEDLQKYGVCSSLVKSHTLGVVTLLAIYLNGTNGNPSVCLTLYLYY